LEIKIDTIQVTVEGDELDAPEIVSALEWHLQEALAQLAKEKAPDRPESVEVESLDLPPVNWPEVSDKTGKLVELILDALAERSALI
jgi:hypothetical protein